MDPYHELYTLKREMFRVGLRRRQISDTLAQNRKHFYTPPDPIKLEMLNESLVKLENTHNTVSDIEACLEVINKMLIDDQQCANVYCNILTTQIDLLLRVAEVDYQTCQSVLTILIQIVFYDDYGTTKKIFEQDSTFQFVSQKALHTTDNRQLELCLHLFVYLTQVKIYRELVEKDNFKFITTCFEYDRFQQFTGLILELLNQVTQHIDQFDNPQIISELFKHYFSDSPAHQALTLQILVHLIQADGIDIEKLLESGLYKQAKECALSTHTNALTSIKFCTMIYSRTRQPTIDHVRFFNTLLRKYVYNDSAQSEMRTFIYWCLSSMCHSREVLQFFIENAIIDTVLETAFNEMNSAQIEISYFLMQVIFVADAAQCSYLVNNNIFAIIEHLLRSDNKEIMDNCTKTTSNLLKKLEETGNSTNELVIHLKQAKYLISQTQIPNIVHQSKMIDVSLQNSFDAYY